MTIVRPTAALLLLIVSGCDTIDPYQRDGAWRPNGANDANLRSMVAVPSDVVVAEPAAPADGGLAAAALNRLNQDRVRALPDSGIAQILPVASGSSSSPAAAAPAGNGN